MRGLWYAALARLVPIVLLLTVAATLIVWIWPRLAITVDMFYPHPPRGVSGAEFFGIIFASLFPALQLNALSLQEARSSSRVGISLTVEYFLVMLLPLVPFTVWHARVVSAHLGTIPPTKPFYGSLLIYAAVGLIFTQRLGQVLGPILTLVFFIGLVVGQDYWGPAAFGRLFSTGKFWQTHWSVVILILMSSLVFTFRTRGATVRPTRVAEE